MNTTILSSAQPVKLTATQSRDEAMRELREVQTLIFSTLRHLENIHPVVIETEVYKDIRNLGHSLPTIMQRLAKMRIES